MFRHLLKNRALWEHRLIDLWSIPHTLSGLFIAYGCLWFGIDPWIGLGISLVAAILWEIFEKITHISDVEHHTNGWSDVVLAQVGYGLGTWFFTIYAGTGVDMVALIAATVLFVFFCVAGWLSHHWYAKK